MFAVRATLRLPVTTSSPNRYPPCVASTSNSRNCVVLPMFMALALDVQVDMPSLMQARRRSTSHFVECVYMNKPPYQSVL